VGANYRLFNSRVTAKGLFKALEKAPDAVHVPEDMGRLTKDRDARGVLRSALWAQPGHPPEARPGASGRSPPATPGRALPSED
jgi:hypothetical protein